MNPAPRFLSVDDVLTLHALAIEDQSGDPTIRDRACHVLSHDVLAVWPSDRLGATLSREAGKRADARRRSARLIEPWYTATGVSEVGRPSDTGNYAGRVPAVRRRDSAIL